jgi:two-component system, sensor histidine kinase and response regulator
MIIRLWKALSTWGLRDGLSEFETKSMVFTNRIGVILSIFVITSVLINIILGSSFFIPALCLSLLFITGTYILTYYRFYLLGKINLMLTILCLLTYMSFNGGIGSGLEFYFLSATVLPFIMFQDRRILFLFLSLCILCLALQKIFAENIVVGNGVAYKVFYIVNSVYSSLFVILAVFFFKKINEEHESLLISKNRIIEEKNNELQRINKELDAFTYSVSHDLHAPLRSIDGFSMLLEKRYGETLDTDGKELISRIRAGTHKMRVLIDELMQLSQSSKLPLKLARVNTADLVREILKDLENDVKADAEIRIADLPDVIADKTLLGQVFLNLLSNAAKYSSKKEKQVIEIGVRSGENEDIFYVKDNGAGFDIQYADKLFKVFQRLHNAEEFEGTGVGLAIIQSIIQRHGGKVWAESELEKGATFYFSLPREKRGSAFTASSRK